MQLLKTSRVRHLCCSNSFLNENSQQNLLFMRKLPMMAISKSIQTFRQFCANDFTIIFNKSIKSFLYIIMTTTITEQVTALHSSNGNVL